MVKTIFEINKPINDKSMFTETCSFDFFNKSIHVKLILKTDLSMFHNSLHNDFIPT